jgi:hypothetical protein
MEDIVTEPLAAAYNVSVEPSVAPIDKELRLVKREEVLQAQIRVVLSSPETDQHAQTALKVALEACEDKRHRLLTLENCEKEQWAQLVKDRNAREARRLSYRIRRSLNNFCPQEIEAFVQEKFCLEGRKEPDLYCVGRSVHSRNFDFLARNHRFTSKLLQRVIRECHVAGLPTVQHLDNGRISKKKERFVTIFRLNLAIK